MAWTIPASRKSSLYIEACGGKWPKPTKRCSKIVARTSLSPRRSATCKEDGVYKPGGTWKLKPPILDASQKYIEKKFGTGPKPVNFVFHGGSGSTREEIREAISYGAIKMNLDTDVQWAFWDGVRGYEAKNRDYLQGQIGNPKGPDAPNKKQYDPRIWLGAAEDSRHQAPPRLLRGPQLRRTQRLDPSPMKLGFCSLSRRSR